MFETISPNGTALDVDLLCGLAEGDKVRVYEDDDRHFAEGEVVRRETPDLDATDRRRYSVWYLVWLSHCDACDEPHELYVHWADLEALR